MRGWRGDAAAQTALTGGAAAFATATLAVAAHDLNRSSFGHYAAVVAISTLVAAASSLGVQATVVRRTAADPASRRGMVEHALVLRLAVALPLAGAVAAVAGAVSPAPDRSTYLLVPAVTAASVAVSGLHLSFRSAGRARVAAAVDCARSAALAGAVATLVAVHALTAFRLVVLQAAIGGLAAVFYGAPALRAAGTRSARLSWVATRQLAAESAGMCAVEGLNGLYLRADAVMLLVLAGSQAVAGYSLAYRVVDLVMLLPGAVGLAAMPSLSAAAPDRRADLVAELSGVMVTLAALVAVGGLLFAPSVLSVMGGVAYARSDVTTLRILVVGASFSFLAGLAATAVVMFEGARPLIRPTVIVVGVNLIANATLDPSLGGRGAALALLLSEAVTCVLAFGAFRRTAGFRIPLRPPAALAPAVAVFAAVGVAVEHLVPASGAGLWRLAVGAVAGLTTLVLVEVAAGRRSVLSGPGAALAGTR